MQQTRVPRMKQGQLENQTGLSQKPDYQVLSEWIKRIIIFYNNI